ncbi:unnamed protein product [Rhizophagus irregularis]|nr:unnamed protein product [Rhizophagus irregularis]
MRSLMLTKWNYRSKLLLEMMRDKLQNNNLVLKYRLEFYGQNEEKNVDDNPWPAEEISHTIIIPPNLHPSSSNGHDESEKDIQ